MRLTGEEIDAAALQLWADVFKAQCALPRNGEAMTEHVNYAENVANLAERAFRAHCAKEGK